MHMEPDISDDLLGRVQTMRVGSRHGRRSPHKPLLLLHSIGRHFNGDERLSTFADLEDDINRLIRQYGLPDSRENAYHPFWHLRNDRLWEIDRPQLVRTTAAGHAYITDLRAHAIRGGLVPDFLDALDSNPNFVWQVVLGLLNDFVPPSLHDDLLRDVGLLGKVGPSVPTGTRSTQARRDPSFRRTVIDAYRYRCALCELDVRVDGQPIGIEAAHIRWHSARGPAQVVNGIALCVLHHKFFDLGLFTVLPDLKVLVGGLAVGASAEESLNKYSGSILPVIPDRVDHRPGAEYLDWHKRAVFRLKPQ